ncbi:MAG TPA: hypothetical protein PLS98_03445 [Dictyoglomaceae bacterium]|nr:hypothetical protein [Dictyoglomaceae bacterium]
MKKCLIILLTILIFFISGCEVPSYSYIKSITLTSSGGNGEIKYLKDSISYEDEFLKLVFQLETNRIYCSIENKTDRNIEIDWSKAKFIFPSGNFTSILCFDPKDKPTSYRKEITPFTKMMVPPQGIVSVYLVPRDMVQSKREYDDYLNKYHTYYSIEGNFFSDFQEGVTVIGINFVANPYGLRSLTYNFTFKIEILRIEK